MSEKSVKKPTATILDLRPKLPKRTPLSFMKVLPTIASEALAERAEILDLRGKRKVYFVIGLGGAGKSTFLTWMLEREGVEFSRVVLASVLASYDTGFHALANRFNTFDDKGAVVNERVMVPTHDPITWLSLLLSSLLKSLDLDAEPLPHAVIDFGAGGEAALIGLYGQLGAAAVLEEFTKADLVPVLVAPFAPREEGLAPLAALTEVGFCPEATLLLPNKGVVSGPLGARLAFEPLRSHPIYEAILNRPGTVEIVIPACVGMHAVENLQIKQAAQFAPLIANRLQIIHWRAAMEEVFKPIIDKGWLL